MEQPDTEYVTVLVQNQMKATAEAMYIFRFCGKSFVKNEIHGHDWNMVVPFFLSQNISVVL